MLILPVPDVEFVETDELSETERNDGGFGSTDEEIQSAPNTSDGFPESESELTNQADVDAGSGEVQGDLEQA